VASTTGGISNRLVSWLSEFEKLRQALKAAA
jgi:hypothetical protein